MKAPACDVYDGTSLATVWNSGILDAGVQTRMKGVRVGVRSLSMIMKVDVYPDVSMSMSDRVCTWKKGVYVGILDRAHELSILQSIYQC